MENLTQLSTQIDTLIAALRASHAETARLRTELAESRTAGTEKEARIHALEDAGKEKDLLNNTLEEEHSKKIAQIAQLEGDLSKKNTQVAQLEADRSQKDTEVAQLIARVGQVLSALPSFDSHA